MQQMYFKPNEYTEYLMKKNNLRNYEQITSFLAKPKKLMLVSHAILIY